VAWRGRWLADLRRPEAPTRREELPVLAATAALIVLFAELTDPGQANELLLVAPAALAFVLRGVLPRMPAEVFAVLVLVPVGVANLAEGNLEGTFFLCLTMVLHTALHLGSTTRALLILVASAATPWITSVLLGPEDLTWPPWAIANVLMFVLGRLLRRQRLLIDELEVAREALATSAVAAERKRIARELHDLAGHTLAAVLLHVTGARHVLRRDLDEAERALIDAETVGRSSLDQIRATVASLRTNETGTDRALAGAADLGALVQEYRRAGLVISATLPSDVGLAQGPVGTALHRITREALANVARHAPANHVDLVVEVVREAAGSGVRLVVTDHGRRAEAPRPDAGHFGLTGMRERAQALGGELEAAPSSDGWRVEARLPVARSDRPGIGAT
jgi:signal transduction histidine kinase